MKWARVSINTTREFSGAVAGVFVEAGLGGVIEEVSQKDQFKGVCLSAYTAYDDSFESRISCLKDHIRGFEILGMDLPSSEVSVDIVEEEDWANSWKKYYKPFRVGKFVIKPIWEEYTAEPGEMLIELDPGMAFGTGQHPTTSLCLEALGDYVKAGDVVVDAGTGSGILSIAAYRMKAGKIYAFDCDKVAVKAAISNFERLGIDADVRQAGDADYLPEKADVVLANIIAKVILYMADSLAASVKPGGILVASGIIDHRADEVLDVLCSKGLELVEKRTLKEWVCLIMRK